MTLEEKFDKFIDFVEKLGPFRFVLYPLIWAIGFYIMIQSMGEKNGE